MNLTLKFFIALHLIIFSGQQTTWTSSIVQDAQVERQFDKDFKKKYSGRKFNYDGPNAEDSEKNKPGSGSKYSNENPMENSWFSFNFNLLNYIFILLLALAVTYLTYILLTDGRSRLFSSRKNKIIKSIDDATIENLADSDIRSFIEKAENKQDYRLALRYYYLLLLKQLTLKNHIKFVDDKTNADYINELANQNFKKDFSYTSYLYDYTWYGEFVLELPQYQMAKGHFDRLLKKIDS